MKTVALTLVLMISAVAFASNPNKVLSEISNKAFIDLNEVNLNKDGKDFVTVSFILVDNQIAINDINGSNPELIKAVSLKLSTITLNRAYTDNNLYRMKFTFTQE